MNTIKGMIEDLNNKNTHICGCTTAGELIIALERLQMLEEQQPCEDVVAGTRSGQSDLGINFNDRIKVKLTDLGRDIFYHQYDWILEQNPKTRAYIKPHYPKVDEEGYTTFLLWEFMQLYGKHIGMAAPNVILPLEIIKCEDE